MTVYTPLNICGNDHHKKQNFHDITAISKRIACPYIYLTMSYDSHQTEMAYAPLENEMLRSWQDSIAIVPIMEV